MDISDATNNLVSVMKAYNIGADDAIQIVDKFDKLNIKLKNVGLKSKFLRSTELAKT